MIISIKKIVVLVMLFYVSAVYSSQKVVTITTLDDYPPFVFKKNGTKKINLEVIPPHKDSISLQGYSWDVVRESFHNMGYTINLKVVPWARGMKYVKNGKAELIFPARKTKKRDKEFFYATQYIDRQNFVIYTKKDLNIKWEGLKSLKGLTVSTIYGWSYGDSFDNASYFKKEPVVKVENGLKKLIKGNIDCVAGYEASYDYQIKKLLEDFDKGKKMIIQNGILDKINKKWGM